MVYMAGDNNLSENMAFSLDDLCTANTVMRPEERKTVNLLAFFDSASATAPTQYIDFSEKDVLHHAVTDKDMYFPRPTNGKKKRIDPENSGSAYSILNFIHWCIKEQNRIADNYIIVFSGHSFGFYGQSLLGDRGSGGYLTLRRFRWALEKANKDYLGKKFAIVGFDSCEMSMLEVGYELKNAAQTVVASEGNVPNYGWGYASMLREFLSHPRRFIEEENDFLAQRGVDFNLVDPDTPDFVKIAAKSFVYAFVKYQRKVAIGGRSVDISAWDLDKIEDLAAKVGELGSLLLWLLGLDRLLTDRKARKEEAILFRNLKAALLSSHNRCQSYMHEQAVDLRDFCEHLMFECLQLERQMEYYDRPAKIVKQYRIVREKCKEVLDAAEECILLSGFSGDEFQFSRGISIYFPWTALTFMLTSPIYGNLQFVWGQRSRARAGRSNGHKGKDRSTGPGSGWDEFLFFYLFFVTLRPSVANSEGVAAACQKALSGDIFDGEWALARENWLLGTKENWQLGTKENWQAGTRENWRLGTKENWLAGTRENWLAGTRENWLAGTKEAMEAYMDIFDRIKNNQLDWSVSGIGDVITSRVPETDETINNVREVESKIKNE